MKEEENKSPKNKIVCEHCGKKIEKDEIIKLKLKKIALFQSIFFATLMKKFLKI